MQKPLLHLLELPLGTPIFQQLAWEEALLRTDTRNWCIFNRGSPPAIVMGISGQPCLHVHKKKWAMAPLLLIRRFSGGGTVVVDEKTLFVTLICQSDALQLPPFPRPLMEWTAEKLYAPLLTGYPFHLEESDYTLGGRKWGGSAQSIIKGRWLHHSSLLWDFRVEHMEYLLHPPKSPAYRQGRCHADFLCRLSDIWKSPDDLFLQLAAQLEQSFDLCLGDRKELEKTAALPHRKALTIIENMN